MENIQLQTRTIRYVYETDWGISHSAHIYEPFGYSIFQAVDWGKIPILAHDWLPKYDYPFRAIQQEEFKEQYEKICNLSLQEKRDILISIKRTFKTMGQQRTMER